MVCQKEAHDDIDSALGETAKVSTPTWADHLYSCRYGYPTGSIELSIKELSSWKQTTGYFNGLGRADGQDPCPPGTRSGRVPDHRRFRRRAQGLEGAVGGHLPAYRRSSGCRRPAPAMWRSRWAMSSWGAGRETDGPTRRTAPQADAATGDPEPVGTSGHRAAHREPDRRATEDADPVEAPEAGGEDHEISEMAGADLAIGGGPGPGPRPRWRSPRV